MAAALEPFTGLIALAAFATATLAADLAARIGFPIRPETARIGCIDGLRGYLAMSVVVHHFIVWTQLSRVTGTWSPPPVRLFFQLGAGPVALFFMATGFVFYPRILDGFRACRWPSIYIGRVFRIVPMVFVSVVIVTLIVAIRSGRGLDRGYPADALQWITTWSEVPLLHDPDTARINAFVLWSLWYEWLFYLFVLPACALAMDVIRGRLPSWSLPAALLVGSLACHGLQPPESLLTYLPLFAIGMLAYECQRHGVIADMLRGPIVAFLAAVGLGLGLVLFSSPYGSAMPLFGFFFVCVACGNTMGGLLQTRAALLLGECSYSIYLLHGILLSVLFVDAADLIGSLSVYELTLLLPCVTIVVTLITPGFHWFIERPAIRAGRWVTGRRTASRRGNEADLAP